MFESKFLDAVINVGSYKPRYFLGRIMVVSIVSIILMYIAKRVFGSPDPNTCVGLGYLILVLAFNCVSEVNLLAVRHFRSMPSFKNRFVPQAIILLVMTYFVAYLWMKIAAIILKDDRLLSHPITQIAILLGIFLLVITHFLILISNITKEWMDNRKELEELKSAKLISDYNSLQDRLNPHFLFNNLSVLKSLIRYNPEDAEVFTQNFTDVYRYLLRSHESQTVSVSYELEFLQAYIALHQERLGDGLTVDISIDEASRQKEIPPMSIQLLVENAIKHNIANRAHPLKIKIFSSDNRLIVENIINIKETTYSTHTGLKTLRSQYQLISKHEVEIVDENGIYRVLLPLL